MLFAGDSWRVCGAFGRLSSFICALPRFWLRLGCVAIVCPAYVLFVFHLRFTCVLFVPHLRFHLCDIYVCTKKLVFHMCFVCVLLMFLFALKLTSSHVLCIRMSPSLSTETSQLKVLNSAKSYSVPRFA